MQFTYANLLKHWEGRRTGRRERKCPHLAFSITLDAGQVLVFHHAWAYKAAQDNPALYVAPVARLEPDQSFLFHPSRSIARNYLSCTENYLLNRLSLGRVAMRRNPSIMELGWRYFTLASNSLYNPDPDAPNNVVGPGRMRVWQPDPASLEFKYVAIDPAPVRHWDSDKRAEYRDALHELHQHAQMRAKLGAFNPLLANWRELWRETLPTPKDAVFNASVDDHESLKRLAAVTIRNSVAWAGAPRDETTLSLNMSRMIDSKREALRRKYGAVVYKTV